MRRHAKAATAAPTTRRRIVGLLAAAVAALALALGATTASAEAPTVSIDPVSGPVYTTLKVSGEVDAKDTFTFWSFETSADGGATWSGFGFQGFVDPNETPGAQPVSFELTGLTPETPYQVRLVANNFSDPEVISSVESFTTLPMTPPSVSIDPPTQITDSSARFSGTIDPEAPAGDPADFDVDWHFECTPACPELAVAEGAPPIAADSDPHAVAADATGLKPGTDYEVTLVATNAGGPTSAGPESFATDPTPPQIVETKAFPLNTEAELQARVNPGGRETTYRFEYGPTAAYGLSTATKTIPAGGDPVTVKAQISGLTPGAGYRYRFVATNSEGTSASAGGQLTTHAETPTTDSCPNAAIRAEQGSRYLPDCRAYEMVSPVDKGSGDIAYTHSFSQASLSGDALAYTSTTAFAGTPSSPKIVTYMARRTAAGWQSKSMMPPMASGSTSPLIFPAYWMFSEDLSRGVLGAEEPALAPGAPAETNNLYVRDTLSNGYSLLTPKGPAGEPYYQPFFADATDDFSHVIFESNRALTADAPEDLVPKLYESIGGQVRLVGIVGGEAAPGGSVAGRGAGSFIEYSKRYTQRTMSRDGSRIVFTAEPNFEGEGQVYLRENGTSTIHVSASQRSTPDPGGTRPALYEGASDDAAFVFFSTEEQMLDEDTNGYRDLYRYGVESGELELLSVDEQPGEFQQGIAGTVEVSEDGSHVYFASENQLIAQRPPKRDGIHVIYLWRDGAGGLVEVARSSATLKEVDTLWRGRYWQGDEARVSRDGSVFVIAVNGDDASGGSAPLEVILFDADTGTRKCLSCTGGPNAGYSTLSPQNTGVNSLSIEYSARALSPDGSKVFFSTPNALLPADSNGRYDVYSYDVESESYALISSGHSSEDSWFLDATPSGDNVFLATRERLVAGDLDQNFDAYVARSGGGFAEPPPPPPPCEGEGCQAPVGPSAAQAPASASFSGPGNASARKKAKAKKRAKKKRAKAQKQKGKNQKSKAAKRKGGRR